MYNNRRIQEPVVTMMNRSSNSSNNSNSSNRNNSSNYSNRKVIVVQEEEPVEIEDIHVEDVAYCEGSSAPLEYNRIGKYESSRC